MELLVALFWVVVLPLVITGAIIWSVYQADQNDRATAIDTAHDHHELVDIRSDAFAENELVATLCITCDKQLGPEVWQAKVDRELAALEVPRKTLEAENAELRARTDELASAVYLQVMPDTESIREQTRIKRYPAAWWSADDYRQHGWKPQFADSNFDHGKGKYVLPFFLGGTSVTRLEFHSAAAAHGWWRSSVPFEKYDQHRKAIERVNAKEVEFEAAVLAPQVDAVTRAMDYHAEQIAKTVGIPPVQFRRRL